MAGESPRRGTAGSRCPRPRPPRPPGARESEGQLEKRAAEQGFRQVQPPDFPIAGSAHSQARRREGAAKPTSQVALKSYETDLKCMVFFHSCYSCCSFRPFQLRSAPPWFGKTFPTFNCFKPYCPQLRTSSPPPPQDLPSLPPLAGSPEHQLGYRDF